MKRVTLVLFMMGLIMAYGQKEKNGTLYKEHPALETVEAFTDAWVAGDSAAVAGYLHEDFRGWNGNTTNKDAEGQTKEQLLRSVGFWQNNVSYLSLEPMQGAYPDVMEFKDGQLWVQTWEQLKGVHNPTGIKIDFPVHRVFRFKDDKIDMIINYDNEAIYRNIGESMGDRKNGTIYNSHELIDNVRNLIHAYEFGDWDKAYGYYADNARFTNIEMPRGESWTLDEVKERNQEMMKSYDITSIDVVGYPDMLDYDLRDTKVVQSWWNIRLTRKSDDKKIVLPVMYIHYFNDEGKITNTNAYFSSKWLD